MAVVFFFAFVNEKMFGLYEFFNEVFVIVIEQAIIVGLENVGLNISKNVSFLLVVVYFSVIVYQVWNFSFGVACVVAFYFFEDGPKFGVACIHFG